jgi:hypothetical protein
MRLITFDGVTLPTAQATYGMPGQAEQALLRATGSRAGAYDLYGTRSPDLDAEVSYEFLFTGGARTALDALRAKLGVSALLVGSTAAGGSTRQCTAKLVSIDERSDGEHEMPAGLRRVKCSFMREPFWYDATLTTATLTTATTSSLTNSGNADVIKSLVFTFTNSLAGGVIITNTTNGQSFTYGAATAATLLIDCGAQLVRVNNVNQYSNSSRPNTQIEFLSLVPGVNALTFSAAVSGTVEFRSAWR